MLSHNCLSFRMASLSTWRPLEWLSPDLAIWPRNFEAGIHLGYIYLSEGPFPPRQRVDSTAQMCARNWNLLTLLITCWRKVEVQIARWHQRSAPILHTSTWISLKIGGEENNNNKIQVCGKLVIMMYNNNKCRPRPFFWEGLAFAYSFSMYLFSVCWFDLIIQIREWS